MKTIVFQYRGKVAHFLRAEANKSATTYPVPPRTVLIGLLGAILGFGKDEPQIVLQDAQLALSGIVPRTHWHNVKLRKDPPAALPYAVKANAKSEKTTAPEKPALIRQEWLWQPHYTIYASLPEPHHENLYERLKEHRWHFTPCLGLSEMMGEVNLLEKENCEAASLPYGSYRVNTVVPQHEGQLDMELAFKEGLALQSLRMPRSVTGERIFTHASYYVERDAKPIPFITGAAWRVGNETVVFL